MFNMKKISVLFVALISFFFISCNKNKTPAVEELKIEPSVEKIPLSKITKKTESAQLSVVTTIFPCFDAARAVLGEHYVSGKGELKMLVKPGVEVHSYDPSPMDIISIQNADLFIYIGGESDQWIEKLISSNNLDKNKCLKLFDFVSLSNEIKFEDEKQIENPHEIDEHIWTSSYNEIRIVNAVRDALINTAKNKNLDEQLSYDFDINAAKYREDISNVNMKIAGIVLKSKSKYFVMADRFPFTYFAKFYGLSFDAAFSGCSTAVEASTATISRLIDKVKENKLGAVYYIELGNHKIADIVAESAGVPALLLQSCQNVTKKDFDSGETWTTLMERNATALEKGLK